jgi:hypothetical protein
MALGNNKESLQIRRISIPFFDELGNTPNGQRFFFPEHPEIDNKTIVGIEAHLKQTPPAIVFAGDFNQVDNVNVNIASFIYLCFYNNANEEIFYNVPLLSIFGKKISGATPKQKIKPYTAKIKTRKCYAYIPANAAIVVGSNLFINLTFYLR